MATQGGFSQTVQFQGLVDTAIGIPNAGTYNVDVKLQLPQLVASGSASAVVTVIKDNSSTVYTGTAGANGAFAQVTCAAGDVIHVVTSSAATIDNAINAVKGTIAISLGPQGY